MPWATEEAPPRPLTPRNLPRLPADPDVWEPRGWQATCHREGAWHDALPETARGLCPFDPGVEPWPQPAPPERLHCFRTSRAVLLSCPPRQEALCWLQEEAPGCSAPP